VTECGDLISFVTTPRKSQGPTKPPHPWAQEIYLLEIEGD